MPAYLVDGRAVVSIAGWKSHWALYVVPTPLFDAIEAAFPEHEAGKGIVRFDLDDRLPDQVTRLLADWRA